MSNWDHAGQRLVEPNRGIRPTIRVQPDFPVRVLMHKDLVLDGDREFVRSRKSGGWQMEARIDRRVAEPIAVRVTQAAAMLGIGRSTLYLCIAAGEIETIKIGSATLIPLASLNEFVSGRRRAHAAPSGD